MNDWQKGAHIAGVIAERDTMAEILKQCQEENGKQRDEIDKWKGLYDLAVASSEAKQEEINRLKKANKAWYDLGVVDGRTESEM